MYTPTQRLMRSRSDKLVAGVAGGIARYLAIDPVFVRLAFVAVALSGVGLVIYPILWLVMPVEPEGAAGTPAGRPSSGEIYVTTAGSSRRARFDPMTGTPLDEGEEIPINNMGGQPPADAVQARRNRLLGVVLVSIGLMVVVNMVAPGLARFVIPALFIAGGVLLLRRGRS